MSELYVTMLGRFSIRRGESSVDDSSNRMRKVWLLLAYLIYSRSTPTSQDSLLHLLQGGSEDSADPNGRIKAMLYRARTLLNQLGDQAGHQLILHRQGSYIWNNDLSLTLDVEEFEQLCAQAARETNPEQQLDHYLQALTLYRGDFLPKLSGEPWVIPISTYYHQMYVDAAGQAMTLLAQTEQWAQCESLAAQALTVDPYNEFFYQVRMRAQLALDDRAAAQRTYEEMSELLFSSFGIMPSDESRQLYRAATRDTQSSSLPAGTVREQLQEPAGAKGAMFCEYDFFRLLYRVQARSIVRSGEIIHIALLSLHSLHKKELSRRSLDTAMDNLQDLVIHSLRQGDVVTRCSVSQFIIMLPQANYENSCAVCQRILRAFSRQYPHSPVRIQYSVQPLEPLRPQDPPSAGDSTR